MLYKKANALPLHSFLCNVFQVPRGSSTLVACGTGEMPDLCSSTSTLAMASAMQPSARVSALHGTELHSATRPWLPRLYVLYVAYSKLILTATMFTRTATKCIHIRPFILLLSGLFMLLLAVSYIPRAQRLVARIMRRKCEESSSVLV